MNIHAVQESADKLQRIAQALAQTGETEVQSFFSALRPLLEAAQSGQILHPMEWRDIPGGWFFTEGNLRNHRELEQAFAEFRLQLTGGDNPVSQHHQ